ncbi:MAG: hypothetical protein ACLPZM_07490 [Thermoplasmata archaeon]
MLPTIGPPQSEPGHVSFDISDEQAADEEQDAADAKVMRYARIGLAIFIVIVLIASLSNYAQQTSTNTSPTTPVPTYGAGGSVIVTQVNVSSPDDACGLNHTHLGGFQADGSSTYPISRWLPAGNAPVPCTVSTISTNTTGFGLSANLPINCTSQYPLMINVYTPKAFDGVLNLTFT